MDLNEKQQLIEALSKGTVTVTFRKVKTNELRVMPCTLNSAVLMANNAISNKDTSEIVADPEYLAVWATDSNGWRSFRFETVEGWEVLGE